MIEQFTLSNGLRVVLERMPQLRSVAMGVWVKAGSMLEKPEENGLSHLMEHMAFKGTATRSARQLADDMDLIGGQMNAATSKLYTTYYAKVCDTDFPRAAELLSDIVLNPLYQDAELKKERNVVLEEIAMVEDTPEDLVYDLINRALYHGQSLAQTILGPKEQVAAYSVNDLKAFRAKYYHPANTVISLAGRLQKQQVIDTLETCFGAWAGGVQAAYTANTVNTPPQTLFTNKKTEQVHLCIGYAGLHNEDKRHYTMLVLNSIFGGGVSSRLFQRIREERGLVYTIYAAPTAYPGCGDFVIYAGATPKGAKQVLAQVQQEVDAFLKYGITEKELQQAKAQLRTGYVLSQESAYSRMASLGSAKLIRDKVRTPGEVLRGIEAVTERKVMQLARDVFSQQPSVAVVGKDARTYMK